jgi:hypothetical protein
MASKEYGICGNRRVPYVGLPVRLVATPEVRGRIVQERTFEGVTTWKVEHNGPDSPAWYPENALMPDGELS